MENRLKFRSAGTEQPSNDRRPIRSRAAIYFPARLNTLACLLFAGCVVLSLASCQEKQAGPASTEPTIQFTDVPSVGQNDALGNAAKLSAIKGRVVGAQPGQEIVLYARAIDNDGQLTWFVQPFVLQPFTRIERDSTWRSGTHPGAEYAALLVRPGFRPPWKTVLLPKEGVAAIAITKGWPPIWHNWWFPLVSALAAGAIVFMFYRVWHFRLTRKLNLQFEERLAERTRVAQELHDTLLQGLLSASMQLHVAVDQLPDGSAAHPALNHVLEMMKQIIDEGRNTVRGLRSSPDGARDLAASLSRVPQQVGHQRGDVDFRVLVDGTSSPLRPMIRDEVYRIAREALVNAFRHSQASSITVELEYSVRLFSVVIKDNGRGIDSTILEDGRDGHFGLSGMRERSQRIGAKFRVRSGIGKGTEVELRVPRKVAFESESRYWASRALKMLYRRVPS